MCSTQQSLELFNYWKDEPNIFLNHVNIFYSWDRAETRISRLYVKGVFCQSHWCHSARLMRCPVAAELLQNHQFWMAFERQPKVKQWIPKQISEKENLKASTECKISLQLCLYLFLCSGVSAVLCQQKWNWDDLIEKQTDLIVRWSELRKPQDSICQHQKNASYCTGNLRKQL